MLVQLPPAWKLDAGRLEAFLQALDGRHRYAFEFRDRSWFDDRAPALLEEHRWAGAFSTRRRQGIDVYCYFDNDEAAHAAANARALAAMVEDRG